MSRMWWYTLGVLTLWIVNPELRRIYGYLFGFSTLDVLAIVPLLSLTPYVWSLTFGGGWRRLPRLLSFAAWLWVGGFTYALVISALSGNLVPGLYDFIGFVLPIAVGLWLVADAAPFQIAYRRVTRILFALATLISLYGVIQYVVAPAWDVAWLRSLIQQYGTTTFGNPVPFQIRVFSTASSPAGFALFLALVLVFALPELSFRKPALLLQVPTWFIAFALSFIRTGWLMFALGALTYVILTPRRNTLLAALTLSAVLVMALMAVLPSATGNDQFFASLNDRLSTFSNLDDDYSQQARTGTYASAPEIIGEAPFGQGLGVLGTSTKLTAKGVSTDFDSGILGRAVEMGIPGVILYLVPLTLLLFGSIYVWNDGRVKRDYVLQAVAAMAIALNVALAFEQLSLDASGLLALTVWLVESLTLRAVKSDPVPLSKLAVA
jgi:hypothetical protein